MPFVELFVPTDRPAAQSRKLADAVHQALVESIGIPADDRFQAVVPRQHTELIYDPNYLGIARSAEFTVVRVTLRRGRTIEQKRAFYRKLAEKARDAAGLRPEDVFVVLVENDLPDWSFGAGVAQYAPAPEAQA